MQSFGQGSQDSTGGVRVMNTWYQNSSEYKSQGRIWLYDPLLTAGTKHFADFTCCWNYNTHIGNTWGHFVQDSTTPYKGFRMKANGGTLDTGMRISVYGYKN